MEQQIINTHDFEASKTEIKKFSEQATTNLKLEAFDAKKKTKTWLKDVLLYGDARTSHNITGEELNKLTSQIEGHLINFNNTQIQLIREFGQVYTALEALDKDYIQAILISIKATEETSKRIEATQNQIKIIVDDQKKTLAVLKKFKEKLDEINHIKDIDKLWDDVQKWNTKLTSVSDAISAITLISNENTKVTNELKTSLENTNSNITQLSENLDKQITQTENIMSDIESNSEKINELKAQDENIKELIQQNKELSERSIAEIYETLKEIDVLNNAINEHSQKLDELAELAEYIHKLSDNVHLTDIDELWDFSHNQSNHINELRTDNEDIRQLIQQNKELAETSLENTNSNIAQLSENLDKQITQTENIMSDIESNSEKINELKAQDENIKELIQQNKELSERSIAEIYETLKEIDVLNNAINEHSQKLDELAELAEYIHKLSDNVHLTDIDELWDFSHNQSNHINELRTDNEDIRQLIQQNKELAETSLVRTDEKADSILQQLNKKIKYAYLIAGGAMTLAIAELVIILLR